MIPSFDDSSEKLSEKKTSQNSRITSLPLWVPLAGGMLTALCIGIFIWYGQTYSNITETSDELPVADDSQRMVRKLINPADVPLPSESVGKLRVYTEPAGFFVLLNDQPVRNSEGILLRTPCEVTTAQDTYSVKVVRHGYRESVQNKQVTHNSEIRFFPTEDSEGQTTGVLQSPLFSLEVGVPVELQSLNTAGFELDPYVEPDGLTIWYVVKNGFRELLYRATRPTIYDHFENPEEFPQAQGSGLPASPSVTSGDWKAVVYAAPQSARIMAVKLEQTPNSNLPSKTHLRATQQMNQEWLSAQITGDGRCLIWVAKEKGSLRTWQVSREDLTEEFSRKKAVEIAIPGIHPCLSSDGLRQYLFDGTHLERARRASIEEPFSHPEPVLDLNLTNYIRDPNRRQYFISDDEQWMYYCDDPRNGGNLHVVRISQGKGWGLVPRGVSLLHENSNPEQVASVDNAVQDSHPSDVLTSNDPVENPEEKSETHVEIEPEPTELPYVGFRQEFVQLMKAKEYDQAIALAEAALKDPKYQADKDIISWDLEDAREVISFWDAARTTFNNMEPGVELRLGASKFTFQEFKEDSIIIKGRNLQAEKKLDTIPGIDLLGILDDHLKGKQTENQLMIGTWLHYQKDRSANAVKARLVKAEELGLIFTERRASRLLHLGREEGKRDHSGIALGYFQRILRQFPDTKTARVAKLEVEKLYTQTKWEALKRDWSTNNAGEYLAARGKVEGAYLKSPSQYENFELQFDFRTEGNNGKGGVYFHYPGEGDIFEKSYKIQLANDFGIPPDLYCTGALFKIQQPTTNAVKKEGFWNSLKLTVNGSRILLFINETKVLETSAQDPDKGKQGFILLDGEFGGIRYRNILLLRLPSNPIPKKNSELDLLLLDE